MGKVSILKSFSLAAAVLCIVGISASPASAKIKKATYLSSQALYSSGDKATSSTFKKTNPWEDTTFIEDRTTASAAKYAADLTSPHDALTYIPTGWGNVKPTSCMKDENCPIIYQTINGSTDGYTGTRSYSKVFSQSNSEDNTQVIGQNLVRQHAVCKGATEFAKGSCKFRCNEGATCKAGYSCNASSGVCVNTSGIKIPGTDHTVACTVNSNPCTGSKTKCLEKASDGKPYFVCVQCTSNSHCTGSTNTTCLTNLDYGKTTHAYTCGCTSNNDKASCGGAGSGYVCDNNKCRVGCAADNDCDANPANKVCNTTDRVCRYPKNAAECWSYLQLRGYADGLCRVCTTDEHCSGATPFCDRNSYTCTSDCTKADTKTCSSAVSSATPVCKQSSGTCVQCSTSNPTDVGQCSTTKSICSGSSACASCTASSQCQTYYGNNYVCVTKTVPSGSGSGSSSGWYNCGDKICNKPCGNAQAICMMAQ